jgi:5-carboxymethyl-2-hydroxymuconate isomerase
MPHLKLEYSSNIKEKVNLKELFSSIHAVLVAVVNADLFRCQSRAISYDSFYIGEGLSQECFIYLEILLLEGRSELQLQEAGNKILKLLEKYFAYSLKEFKLQIAVRILEFPSSRYFKVESKGRDRK